MRVTDLEKFSLEQIWRPYQGMDGCVADFGPRLDKPPLPLLDTAEALCHDTAWSRCVIDRLAGIGVTFPDYIQHPLVTIIRFKIKRAKP